MTLADFPKALVAQAAALVSAAGITDPTLAANAEFDYISMGNPNFIAEDAAVFSENPVSTTQAVFTDPITPPPTIGVLAAAQTVTEASSGTTPVTFYVDLTSAATSDTVVNYTAAAGVDSIGADGKTWFSASDFGGAFPSGSVTIAAGHTVGKVTINVPTGTLGAAPDKWVGISVSSPSGDPIYTPTAQVEVVNNQPEPGEASRPMLELIQPPLPVVAENPATLAQSGNAYILNLGNVVQNTELPDFQFSLANLAALGSNTLLSSITEETGTGFAVTGYQPPSKLRPGDSYSQLYIQPDATSLGAQSETLTFKSLEMNDSGYLASLSNITLTVEDTIVAPALATVSTPSLTFANVRVGTPESKPVTVTNSAAAGAANLDVSAGATVNATESGNISQLVPLSSDGTHISVGLDTSTAGLITGTATLDAFSNLGNGVEVAALPSPTISVSGAVYRVADGQAAPAFAIVHVGDNGSQALVVSNVDPTDGYSEALRASVVSSSGAISASGVSTGFIAAGSADSTSLSLNYSTATAGTVSGSVALDFVSDGTGSDNLGALDLGVSPVAVAVQINNYAQAAWEEISGGGALQQTGYNYTLDLGSVYQGAAPITLDLGVLNSASGQSDQLSGDFTTSSSSAFDLSGFGAFSGLSSGQADKGLTLTFNTGAAGVFTETITLDPTGSNADYSGALAPETLTITGTVVPPIPNLTVAQYLANPSAADGAPHGFDLTDTAAKVSTIFDTLNADSHLDAITLTDTGTPSLTLTALQALDDTTALGKISNASYAIAILDTAADVAAHLDELNADPTIISITLTDPSDPLAVSVAQLTSDAGALGELTNGYSLAVTGSAAAIESGLPTLTADAKHIGSITASDSPPSFSTAIFVADEPTLDKIVGGFAISDTAKHIQDNLPALLADASHIDSIAASGTVGVSAATFIADRAALDKIAGGFGIVDTAADIKSYLDFLSDPSIVAVTISDNAAVGANVAQLTSDAATIAELRNANGSAYQLAISDTAANVQNGIATLAANTHIGSITASGGPASFSTAIFAADKATLDKIVGGFGITDTAADVSGSLDALQGDVADIASIKFSDASPPTLNITSAQLAADAAALAKIVSPYILDVANASGSSSYVGYGNGLVFNIGGGTTSTIKGGGLNESFVFGAGFKTATISEFATHGGVASNDSISLAKSDFANWATLLSDAHTGAGGSISFVSQTSGATLTLAGVSVAAFQKPGAPYQSEFSFHA